MATKDDTPAADAAEDRFTLQENADGTVLFSDDTDTEAPPRQAAAEAPAPAPEAHDEDDEDGHAEEASASTDEEREAIRARRRQERADRKNRQRQRESERERELQTLRRQNEQILQQLNMIQRRGAGTELAQLDNEIERTNQYAQELKSVIADATVQQKGDIVADATDRLVKINRRAEYLNNVRTQYVEGLRKQAAPPQPSPTQPRVPPAVAENARAWIQANSWYDPEGKDLDSKIVQTLDNELTAEQYDPATPAYWVELSSRVSKYLPHRAAAAASPNGANRGYTDGARRSVGTPVGGSGREGAAGSGSNANRGYVLSAERVRALKEAGLWDDPKARADAIRRYREYDRAAATR